MAFPGSEALVEEAERLLGRRLPDPHRRRLILENGGEIRADGRRWTLYPVLDPTDRRTVARTASHIVRENASMRREWPDMLLADQIAIADDGGGDLLVIAVDDDTVLAWDHETGLASPVSVSWD